MGWCRNLHPWKTLTPTPEPTRPRSLTLNCEEPAVVAVRAARAQGTAARRRLIHIEVLEIRRGKSPLIIGDLDPLPASPSA